jgi:allantoinase
MSNPANVAIRSRRVVTPEGERPATVVVRDGRIAAVEPHDVEVADCLDVGDLALLPGFVDSHVHINDPGRAHWEGFDTATRAAALAGITTVVDMPLNSLPPTVDPDALATKIAATEGRRHVDVAFWGGIVPGSEVHLPALAAAGVCGFKVFTCDSGVPEYGGFAPAQLVDVLAQVAPTGLPVIVHAEDPAVLAAHPIPADADRRAHDSWLASRPPEAELAAIRALIDAVRRTGTRAHVLHLSAAGGVALLQAARAEGLPLTVETCPHYLTLDAATIPAGAVDHKCAPPIRDAANQAALWAALRAGAIDAVVSDHSPSTPADKHLDDGDVLAAWGGIASLQLGPRLIWTAARARGADLGDLVRWMAAGPAELAGLAHKGRIVVGADADLVVFDPDATATVDRAALAHRHPISPYHGRTLHGAVRSVHLGGRRIVTDGELTAGATGHLRRHVPPTGKPPPP